MLLFEGLLRGFEGRHEASKLMTRTHTVMKSETGEYACFFIVGFILKKTGAKTSFAMEECELNRASLRGI